MLSTFDEDLSLWNADSTLPAGKRPQNASTVLELAAAGIALRIMETTSGDTE